MRPQPFKDRRLWILIAATLIGLSIAWTVKQPCLDHNWDGFQYRRLCYNDIQPLYGARHMDKDVVPYVDNTPGDDPNDLTQRHGFLEYPVLTGVVMHIAARLSDNGEEFFAWNAILLSAFAVGTTILLFLIVEDKRYVALWALGPPLMLYAFHNWDLIAIFFAVLAAYCYQKNNAFGAGAALALGASAKMFPAFLAPAMGLAILRRERRLGPDSWRFGLGFLAAALAANLPFFLANRELFLETYRFHLRRDPNFETIWYVIGHYGRKWHVDWLLDQHQAEEFLSVLVPLALLAGLTLVGVLVWRGQLDAFQGGFASLLLFMIFNKIFSVQYAMWLLPFFALLHLGSLRFAIYALSDLFVYVSIFTFFRYSDTASNARYFDYVGMSVVGRTATHAWLLGTALAWGLRWRAAGSAPASPTLSEPGPASKPG